VIEKPLIRLMIAVSLPIATALLMEQLPKTGVAEVPFTFQVKDQMLPPGIYSVKQADLGRGIRIQNQTVATAGLKCVAAKLRFGRVEEPRLVFEKTAGCYSLSEIWFDAEGRGLILQDGRLEDREVRSVNFR
jgi:hypothetical protein